MKKLLSIALAVVMMMAVCVPAFAAETATNITKDDPAVVDGAQTGTADVYTIYETTDYTYMVTIPADASIDWDSPDAVTMPYFVTSQLLIGDTLVVSVAPEDDGDDTNDANIGAMKDANGVATAMTFTLANGGATVFGAVNDNEAPAAQPAVTVNWIDDIAIGRYTGTLTYTVVYTPATTA